MQKGLLESEKQDKNDDSPVTVADYGACYASLPIISEQHWYALTSQQHWQSLVRMWRLRVALLILTTGAQAVVAWVLSKASPDERLSMIAEEDSADLQ